VARLRQAGLKTGILCSPLLPGLTDTGKALDGMAKKAKEADASFFCAQPLFLKPCSKEIYLRFVREHFPSLEPMYRQRFDSEAFVPKAYRTRIESLVRAVCSKYSLALRGGGARLTRERADAGQQSSGLRFAPSEMPFLQIH
jgi:DNA repair photolyase